MVDSHILPHLHNHPITLVLVPSSVATLTPEFTSSNSATSPPFPGESIVGLQSSVNPTVIRLSGVENGLEFWRRAPVIGELDNQLGEKLGDLGYRLDCGSSKLKAQSSRIAGSQNADWKGVKQKALIEGEARVTVEAREVCLRIVNEMGLYETRTGKAVVVRLEVGMTGCADY